MYITSNEDYEILKDIILEKKYFRNRGAGISGHCAQFEKEFSKVIGTEYALMVTSGTNALICALSSLDLKKDDEVIIPSYTFFATASAVIHAKATPVIVNVNEYLTIDPLAVKAAITKNTKAIIAVHMDGHPCDMDALLSLAQENNLFLIEDVAQAVGGSYHGKRLGSIGDIGCFSFNVDKIISCGEGGAITTNNRIYYEKSLCIQDGCCSFGPTLRSEFKNIKPFIGQSMRVSEISGALMSVQLKRLDMILDSLRAAKRIIIEELKTHNIVFLPSIDEDGDCATSIYLRYSTPEKVSSTAIELVKNNIVAYPLTARPAHACWQWMHLLAQVRPEELYKNNNFLSSIEYLTTTLRIDIPYNLNLEEVRAFAFKVCSHV